MQIDGTFAWIRLRVSSSALRPFRHPVPTFFTGHYCPFNIDRMLADQQFSAPVVFLQMKNRQ